MLSNVDDDHMTIALISTCCVYRSDHFGASSNLDQVIYHGAEKMNFVRESCLYIFH